MPPVSIFYALLGVKIPVPFAPSLRLQKHDHLHALVSRHSCYLCGLTTRRHWITFFKK